MSASSSHRRRGPMPAAFTLIELLIVVAIIAILAAIAVPNFLEAQTRAKISRVRADLRSIATGLESYRTDWNRYPPTPFVQGGDNGVLHVVPDALARPVSYLSTADLFDTFISVDLSDFQMLRTTGALNGQVAAWQPETAPAYSIDPKSPSAGRRYYYRSHRDPRRNAGLQADFLEYVVPHMGDWVLTSLGPDKQRNLILGSGNPANPPVFDTFIPYDPTNGTISEGDIIRSQRESEGTLSN